MNDVQIKSDDSFRIILPKQPGTDSVTLEDLFTICLDRWPDIDTCEIAFELKNGVPTVSRKSLIPIQRAVFKHMPHDGKVVFSNGFYPERLGHIIPAVEGTLGATHPNQVAIVQPDYLRIEFVKIEEQEPNTIRTCEI